MNKFFQIIFKLCLSGLIILPPVMAESWVEAGAREFEELRLRQLQTVQNEGNIAPFSSDGCSGNQSKNWELLAKTLPGFEQQFGDKPPWESCCVKHDKAYWRGDTVDGYAKRKQADVELRQCVAATGVRLTPQLSLEYSVSEEEVREAFSLTSELMYQAVRLGGLPCSLLPWRWGYGWSNCAFATVSNIKENYSDIKRDEHLVFFNTAGWLDADNATWHLPIHAWIYEPQDSVVRKGVFTSVLKSKYGLEATSDTEENFRHRTNLIIADNERGKKLVIRFAGRDIALPASKENGHVYTILKLTTEVVDAFSEQNRLQFFAVTKPDDERRFEGEVQLVSSTGISVISDIDDTIKISNVTNHERLFDNTFFKDFQEVPGMPGLYQQLTTRGATFHYVSSSPWQLYTPLQEFAQNTGLPWATMNLKAVRFRDETLFNLFKKGTETKPEQIEPFLQRYPMRRFILIGDSGEQDPEVYGDIARRYPSRIHRILIRNVDQGSAEDERYQIAFKGIPRDLWQLFDQPEQIAVDELINNQ